MSLLYYKINNIYYFSLCKTVSVSVFIKRGLEILLSPKIQIMSSHHLNEKIYKQWSPESLSVCA